MTRRLAWILFWLCIASIGAAADTYDSSFLVRLHLRSAEEKSAATGCGLDVVDAGPDWAKVLVTSDQLGDLLRLGADLEVLTGEMERDRRLWAEADAASAAATGYYTASKFNTSNPPASSLMKHLLQLNTQYPEITRLVNLGATQDGAYDIPAIKVTSNPDALEAEPKIRIYGSIHGDEKGAMMVACDVLDWILANYPADPDARKLVGEAELWFIPMGNPWGNAHNSRYNARGKDLNRNFWGPDPDSPCDAPPCFSEKETQAIRDLTEVSGKRFATSLSFHGGAVCFNAVYNYTHDPSPDEPNFFSARSGGPPSPYCGFADPGNFCALPAPDGLAEAYMDACTTPDFWCTNGADWYITHGDTNDWSYSRWSGLDTTLEVTVDKTPPVGQIPVFAAQHRRATINYMLKTFQGISGVVSDGGTGLPLDGTVRATATALRAAPVPHAFKEVYTDRSAGDYHRVLPPGTYRVECSAPGYLPAIFDGIQVAAGATTVLNFPMVVMRATASAAPEGGQAPLAVSFRGSAEGGTPPYTYAWDFGDGSGSDLQDPVHSYPLEGTYSPLLTVTDSAGHSASDAHLVIAVNPAPCSLACTASASPESGLAPLDVLFSADISAPSCPGSPSFAWEFGDGGTSPDAAPAHRFAQPGTYAWSLVVIQGGETCSASGSVRVQPHVPGDEDGDGTISIGEVQRVINMFLGSLPAGSGADCDGDGAVSIGEVQKVINGFLGLATSC